MAKENKSKQPISPETPKKPIVSDIDDIFSGKTTKIDKVAVKTPTPISKNAKKKAKKQAIVAAETTNDSAEEEQEEDVKEMTETEMRKVEEVVFAELAAAKNLKKRQAPPPPPPKMVRKIDLAILGERKQRTTDDGYPLYDVNDKDLRIGLGQDTPECPFDCACCKY
ncbi:hypothetical protein CLU79DRAFT_835806 [Phycomyces nitens]|nr:hypothetical protein CLU79DRAFT_835806 [Phycomyces nitens]